MGCRANASNEVIIEVGTKVIQLQTAILKLNLCFTEKKNVERIQRSFISGFSFLLFDRHIVRCEFGRQRKLEKNMSRETSAWVAMVQRILF